MRLVRWYIMTINPRSAQIRVWVANEQIADSNTCQITDACACGSTACQGTTGDGRGCKSELIYRKIEMQSDSHLF